MRTINCSACKARNDYEAEKCASCGEPLAMAKIEEAMQGIRDTTDRFKHQQAARNPGFSSINGFGTTLVDYRPRGDGTYDAVRWIIAMGIPLVPLGGYVIEPIRQENTYGRQTSSFTVLERTPLSVQRILRTYLLVIVGLAPLVTGWMNHRWVNRTLDGGPALFLMVATYVWAAYIIPFRIKNDSGAYKPLLAATAR